ncbi:MAG: GGDEF domain-containing protein [Acidobacteria bacterium]|nr:GGDEF domain-containing protein [Acidobacteriota bacterium]MDW7984056.1 GGDEF domain-containing protein [Acidobacteriota bacterium]
MQASRHGPRLRLFRGGTSRRAVLAAGFQSLALAMGLRPSGQELWRTGAVFRVILTTVAPFMILSGWVSMAWRDYLGLTVATWAYAAFVWWVSPRAGVWLDGLNFWVDLSLFVLLLQASGGSESPLTILIYLWLMAMSTANLRERLGLSLGVLNGAALAALALGALGSPRIGSFLGFHGAVILLFDVLALGYIRQLQSSRLDTLTRTLHRGAGLEKLREWIRAGRSFRLAFLDLQGFKQINDAYGHRVGDEVLQAVAGRLLNAFRSQDLVIRYGGDEFIVVTAASDALERLQQVFTDPVRTSVGPLKVEGDAGLVEVHTGEDLNSLLSRADAAMYRVRGARHETQVSPQ